MDERLLKRAVQSIEMPEDMKDRIVNNCRSGEAKPLFTPKKRFVYMPMAVTACVCALAIALTGVWVWQLRVLSEGDGESPATNTPDNTATVPEEDVINVIPLSDEDLHTRTDAYKSGYSQEVDDIDNLVTMTEEEINEYYGIETAYLLNSLNIKLTPINPSEVDGLTCSYVYRTDGGWGETYFDTNAFIYGEDGEICVYISKFAIPHSIPKLWSDKEQLSTISGVTAAVGMREGDGWKQYRTEFKLEEYGLCFNVWCDYDMIGKVVGAIKEHCDSQFWWSVPENAQPLTLDKLREICKGDTSKLSWNDFRQYQATEIGSGLYIMRYPIEEKYSLTIGGVPEEDPWYMRFRTEGQYYDIDIREDSLEEYLNDPIPEGDFVNIIPLEEDEINYSMSADFAEEDRVYMTDKELSEYYGIDVTAFGNIPSYMEAQSYEHNDGMRCIWWKDSDGSGLYYDKNTFSFANPNGTEVIDISLGRLMVSNDKLWEKMKMRSRIGGRDVVIGKTEQEHYIAELRSKDGEIAIVVSAFGGVSFDEFCGVISALVEQTEERRNFVNETYPYPQEYPGNLTEIADVLIWPTDGGYISEWGYWDGGYSGHAGIDISGIESGASVYAGADGVVTFAGWEANLGYYVEIYHSDLGITSCYAHNSTLDVSVGQQVAKGERIAGAGSTGYANSVLIHIAVKINGVNVNPKDYFGLRFGADGENIHFIYAEYSEDKNDDLWWSLNGLTGPDEQPTPLLDEDFTAMSRDELIGYYGVNIFPDSLSSERYKLNEGGENGFGVYRQNGGKGEVYFDINSFSYSGRTDNYLRINVEKDGLPYKTKLIEEMMSDPYLLSYVNGHPVLFMYDDYGVEFAIFMTASGKAGFRISAYNIGFGAVNTTNLVDIVSQLIDQ